MADRLARLVRGVCSRCASARRADPGVGRAGEFGRSARTPAASARAARRGAVSRGRRGKAVGGTGSRRAMPHAGTARAATTAAARGPARFPFAWGRGSGPRGRGAAATAARPEDPALFPARLTHRLRRKSACSWRQTRERVALAAARSGQRGRRRSVGVTIQTFPCGEQSRTRSGLCPRLTGRSARCFGAQTLPGVGRERWRSKRTREQVCGARWACRKFGALMFRAFKFIRAPG